MAILSPNIMVMTKALRKAARDLRRDFGEMEQLRGASKNIASFAQTSKKRAESFIEEELQIARPDYGFVFLNTEAPHREKGPQDQRWIVSAFHDSIDNFIHAVPLFSLSLALELNGKTVASLIYNPISEELFWAEQDGAAHLNGQRIMASQRKKLQDALLAFDLSAQGKEATASLTKVPALLGQSVRIQTTGSLALDFAYLCSSRYDALWQNQTTAFEAAAGLLLLQEARALSSVDKKNEGCSIIAANTELFSAFETLLKD